MAVDRTTLSIGNWNSDGVDVYGVEWTLTGLTGWWEPPGVKDNASQRPQGPGSFDAPVYDDVRVVGVTERISAPSPQVLHSAVSQFGAVRAALMGGAVVVGHQPDGDYSVTAKAATGWQVQSPNNSSPLAFEYQFSVTCRDPYKYGPTVQGSTGLPAPGGSLQFPLWSTRGVLDFGVQGPSGQVTLPNPGSVAAWPVFTVQGPLVGGFAVSDVLSGASVVFADDVPASATVVMDSGAGRVWLNGSDRTGSLTSRNWWPVPAGGASTVQFRALAAGQSGTLTASVSPAYY